MTDASSFLMLALQTVSARLAIILALAMTFGLFCWAMWRGDAIGLYTAATFALLVYLPVLMRGDSRGIQKD